MRWPRSSFNYPRRAEYFFRAGNLPAGMARNEQDDLPILKGSFAERDGYGRHAFFLNSMPSTLTEMAIKPVDPDAIGSVANYI